MKKTLSIITLGTILLFAVSAMAHDKVIVVPLSKKPIGDVSAEFVLEGQTFSNASGSATGTMPNNGAVIIIPGDTVKTIPIGYHNGSGTVSTDVNLIPANIKDGASIFGQTGTFTEETGNPMTATDLLSDKVGFVNGLQVIGNMPTQNIVDTTTAVSAGYYSATDLAAVDTDLISENICSDVTIFGVTGTTTCPPLDCNGDRGGAATTTSCGCTGGTSGVDPSVTCITSTTGKVWMDRDLGASQVATSSTDTLAYGDLYQWGRLADGHEIRTPSPATTPTLSLLDVPGHGDFITTVTDPWDWHVPQNDDLWQGVSGTNNPCPSGFRLPTDAEWNIERLSWSSNNAAGAFVSLKLVLAGSRGRVDGSIYEPGVNAAYWNSGVLVPHARTLFLSATYSGPSSNHRAAGLSVRCIKD